MHRSHIAFISSSLRFENLVCIVAIDFELQQFIPKVLCQEYPMLLSVDLKEGSLQITSLTWLPLLCPSI